MRSEAKPNEGGPPPEWNTVPVYAYKGVSASGRTTRGSVSAETLRAARAKMRSDGVFLTEISESQISVVPDTGEKTRFSFKLVGRIPAMERARATRQLATLVGAGIPLVEALGAMVEQVEHPRLKSVLAQVRERVNEGASLAEALDQTGQFDQLYVSMVSAGEESGALELVLERVADYLEDQVRLQNRITSVLIYPAVMLAFAMIVVAALVTVVLPQITELLQSLDQPLPFYTRWIIGASEFARSWWWAMALALGAAALVVRQLVQTERGRMVYDRLRLSLPVVGRISRLISIARFTRTLSTLLAGGVPIVRALDIGRQVANNAVLAEAIDSARTSIVEGAPLAQPLRTSGQFPPLVTHMVAVGEQTGELEAMLGKVADTYDEQVETTVTRLTALLEPLLILLMVGIVLVIILATLMPLLQITSSIR
ncbi:MAG: type II secretion system inner membrane protein GspF [Proteobacteria bacterium]|nr:type II secretion system inner membrane protein GspF [Pseudomonadota bacterium]